MFVNKVSENWLLQFLRNGEYPPEVKKFSSAVEELVYHFLVRYQKEPDLDFVNFSCEYFQERIIKTKCSDCGEQCECGRAEKWKLIRDKAKSMIKEMIDNLAKQRGGVDLMKPTKPKSSRK